ncbi:MAG TPA: dihydrodipicolinate synthase family protein [Intrasporangium sp.]|uniref:dihydrodipicolinate synthase family protein n=1 Tax=Intrasporangium sp. TaxID=1925024 RepID=UPI002D7A0335|nr:dihydrodipicolinate synthase family protein [Intrasporangium sp.]HET7398559.1 dihydrodipicolinate synthase family protein [Intrasporangium sp.]
MAAALSGVLVALATPFGPDGELDETTLRALVDRTIDGGVHGVVACGSTGEFSALTVDERRLVVETVVDQTAHRVPVIAQTGSTSTAEAVALSRHAQSVGVDVVMPVAPFYEPLSLAETTNYLRRVASSVEIPVMLYNLPAVTGVDLTPDTVATLAREVENIRYVKNTSPDMAQAAQLIHHYGDLVGTFVGWDSLILSSLVSGAAGVMAGTANVVPAELVAVYDAVESGDLDAARQAWAVVYPLLDAALSVNYIAAVKVALEAAGFPAGSTREPTLSLEPADARHIAQLASAFRSQPVA